MPIIRARDDTRFAIVSPVFIPGADVSAATGRSSALVARCQNYIVLHANVPGRPPRICTIVVDGGKPGAGNAGEVPRDFSRLEPGWHLVDI